MSGSSPLSRFQPVLALRSRILRAIRQFFDARGFLEVETPVRIAAPALELHIDAMPSGDAWLRTSPELHMKRLLAAGCERVYQLGPCFRQGERGERHNPEFTLLEWYRTNADYRDILAETKALIAAVAEAALGRTWIDFSRTHIELMPVWEVLTVTEAFKTFAGWNPVEYFDADRFDLDMVNKVEPNLPTACPVVLMDYPAAVAALARRKPEDPRVAERWELYIGGIEIANAFSELTDPAEQRKRFEACAVERRALGKPVYPLDEYFMAALESGLPPAAGIALGVDRLVMLLAGATSLDGVLPFRDP
ncbi:MAG: EF-P lysine aminoacylase EpmA [Kiritimatiellaeota bacterium]|nr:EF-P lysine aminoacylase EpmA [Kiritimatiellota bacterium]